MEKERVITEVLQLLSNHKAAIVVSLFDTHNDDYQSVWIERDPLSFWMHLDFANRLRLIDLATVHYAEGNKSGRKS